MTTGKAKSRLSMDAPTETPKRPENLKKPMTLHYMHHGLLAQALVSKADPINSQNKTKLCASLPEAGPPTLALAG